MWCAAPDGTPAANADLALRSPSERIDIGDGKLRSNGVVPIVNTDSDGRFSLPPREAPFVIVVAHPSGFAVKNIESRAGQQNAPLEIALTAWGRVEGVFKIGSRLRSNQQISLFVSGLRDSPKRQVIWRVSTTTDDEGRFVFERVLPSIVTIERTVPLTAHHGLLVHEVPGFEVRPKESIRLAIGGVGRPVVGSVAIPAELKAKWGGVDPSVRINFEVHAPKPYDQLSDEEQARWVLEWRKTYRSYACLIQSDGSFRFDDVPAGAYELKVRVDEEFKETYLRGSFQGSRRLGGSHGPLPCRRFLAGYPEPTSRSTSARSHSSLIEARKLAISRRISRPRHWTATGPSKSATSAANSFSSFFGIARPF